MKEPIQAENPELDRTLSLFSLVMMGMGMMIGAGVFVASGLSIAKGGCGAVIIAFALNGVIAMFTAMSYAELSSAIPRAGGPYNWASYGFGKFAGFVTGWMEWLAATVAGSLYAVTFAAYTVKFANEVFSLGLTGWTLSLTVKAVALLVALTFIYVNYRGASETGTIAVIMAAGQMITLALICIAALFTGLANPERMANFQDFLPAGWDKVLIAMGLTYVAFEGFEVICQAGDEAVEPRRNLPKALFYSLVAVVTVYVLISLAITIGVTGGDPMAFFREGGDPAVRFSDAVKNLMPLGGVIVTVAVVFSATSALNATVYSATRISYALGRDKFLPPFFAKVSKKTRVPVFALSVTSVLVILIAEVLPIEHVAAAASILFICVFMMGNLSVIKIRKDAAENLKYGYVMPLFPFLPIIAALVQMVMIFRLFGESHWTGPIVIGWLATGIVIFVAYSRHRAIAQKLPVGVLETKHVPLRKEYSILVPLANPKNIPELMGRATQLAKAKDGEIVLFNFIRIPDQSPVTVAENFLDDSRNTIQKAIEFVAGDVPVHSVIKYGRDFYTGIMKTLTDYDIDIVIMGWKGASRKFYYALGSTIDPFIENVPCDAMVLKSRDVTINQAGASPMTPHRILVPTGRGSIAQTILSIEIANAVRPPDGEVTLLTLKSPGQSDKVVDRTLEPFIKYAKGLDLTVQVKVRESTRIAATIIEESREYDLLIIGASQRGWFKKHVFGEIPETIATESRSEVIMVKSGRGVQSLITRWLGR